MTNKLSGESQPGSLGSPVLTSFLSGSPFAVAPLSRVNPYGQSSAVIFNSILSHA